ncbi:MAG: zinc ribbon domain-containing protein [Gloeocapsa sp. UFS-A4-WI-NPMV-4B04]|jgi:hypothetical protein|nr:zinc ribbon domain-containing protein [Gloeocapsa sp. UFS-A4-WI-NPMV-4B04]
MPNCPRCHQSINAQAVTCPYCRTPLKAYGHPGIHLHRATGELSLCESCIYHADDSCNFPQRPHARECTLYQDIEQNQLNINQYNNDAWGKGKALRGFLPSITNWLKRNQIWLLLLALLLVSFLIALF